MFIRRGLFFLFISFLSFNGTLGWAKTEAELWKETGLDFDALKSNRNFQPTVCLENERNFLGCIMALEHILGHLPDPLMLKVVGNRLRTTSSDKFYPLGEFQAQDAESVEALLKKVRNRMSIIRSRRIALYPHFDQESLADLFNEVYKKAQGILEDQSSLVAGTAYNVYLSYFADPHTKIMPRSFMYPKPEDKDKIFGIGSHVILNSEKNGVFLIPGKNSPAHLAGLQTGDVVLKVDGEFPQGGGGGPGNISLWIDKITGPEGTKVRLEVESQCDKKVRTVEVIRGQINKPMNLLEDSTFKSFTAPFGESVDSWLCQKEDPVPGQLQMLYIPLRTFFSPKKISFCEDFVQLLEKDMANPDSLGLVVDLRNNSGGDLSEVLCMLDQLVASDGVLFSTIPVDKKYRELEGSKDFYFKPFSRYSKPVVVLINSDSASASEIFAGVIQDTGRGWVVGERSAGKGSVQTVKTFGREGFSPLVFAKTESLYLLPSGRSPQIQGITPDFHYKRNGEKGELTLGKESELYNSIKDFENPPWVQNRPREFSLIQDCVSQSHSRSQAFLNHKDSVPEEYFYFKNYQDVLAQDVLECTYTQGVRSKFRVLPEFDPLPEHRHER